ncbi:hypothetical protein [Streptomyces sp. NPDC051561]|uniref:hypothetical protein n=1 Tax=Streptomyces sp. NPDC051561 TaxID=3365658 RepID=UPI0037970041
MNIQRNHSLLVFGIALTGLAGCGAGGEKGLPEIGTPEVVTSTKDLRLPLDAYRMTRDERNLALRAQVAELNKCLKRFGYDLDLRAPSSQNSMSSNERIYGVTDLSEVRVSGYRIPSHKTRERPASPKLSPEVQTIIKGQGQTQANGTAIPRGGCDAESKRSLSRGGPMVEDLDRAGMIAAEESQKAKGDPRLKEAFGAWSECMRKKGYSYNEPMDANDDPAFSVGKSASPKEIRTAVSDVECKKSVNLLGVWTAVDTAYQKIAIEQHAEELKEVQKAIQVILRNSKV